MTLELCTTECDTYTTVQKADTLAALIINSSSNINVCPKIIEMKWP